MNSKYLLEGTEPVAYKDVLKLDRKFEAIDTRVARTDITEDIFVSTIFLGLDYQFNKKGPPLLFETMCFGGPLDQEQERYSNWAQAEQGHEFMCGRVRERLEKEAIDAQQPM